MARPELLDERPGWSGGKLNATTLLLEPLSEADGEALVRELLGADLPEPVAGRIVAAAEGNPLFVEELIGMLLDDGHLRRVGGGVEVAGAIERVELPPTIQALLTARLDRLSNAERGVVERASIEGQVFHLGALAALGAAPDEILPTVRTLARKQLFRSDQAALPGQDAYRFRHILIREAAYERVAKEVRARWHEAFADWLEALAGERVSEYEELLGHHLAEAARYRLEIGDHGTETRCWHGGRPPSAGRSPTAPPRRRTSWPLRAYSAGSPRSCRPTILPGRSRSPTARAGCSQPATWTRPPRCRAPPERPRRRAVTVPSQLVCESLGRMVEISASADVGVGEEQAALDRARAGAEETERAGRLGEAARLWYLTAIWEGNTMLRCAKARAAAERTLELGQRVRSPWLEAFGAVAGVMFLLRGRGRIPDLLRAGEERASGFGRAIRADYLADAAVLLAQRGEVDAALAAVADVIAIAQELGYKAYVSQWVKGAVLLDAGRPAEAIEPLELAATTARRGGRRRLGILHHRAPRPRPRPGPATSRRRRAEARRRGRCRRPSTAGPRSSGAAPPCASAQRRAGRPKPGRSPTSWSPSWPTSTTRASSSTPASTPPKGTERPATGRPPRRCCAARSQTATSAEATGLARQAAAALERVRADATARAESRSTTP